VQFVRRTRTSEASPFKSFAPDQSRNQFFEPAEAASGALAQRFKAYEVDTVVWFQPGKEARNTALHLADMGIRLLGVANDSFCHIPCRYQVRREPAIRKLLSNWKERTTDRLVLVQSKDQRSVALGETPDDILFAARNRIYVSRNGGVFWRAVAVELPEIRDVAWA